MIGVDIYIPHSLIPFTPLSYLGTLARDYSSSRCNKGLSSLAGFKKDRDVKGLVTLTNYIEICIISVLQVKFLPIV